MNLLQRVRLGAPRTFTLVNAAWREAQLAGRPSVTPDDLLLALLTAGGPAARILAAHGATVDGLRAAARDRDADDLASLGIQAPTRHPLALDPTDLQHETRRPEIAPDLQALLDAHGGRSEAHLLGRLLDHGSGAAETALRRAGVDVAAVRAELVSAPEQLSAARATPVPGLLDGLSASTVTADRFVAVPFEVLARVVREPECVVRWFIIGPDPVVGADGVLRTTLRRGDRTQETELRRVLDRADEKTAEVAWQEFYPGRREEPGSYLHLRLNPATGGTELRITRGFRGFGRLGFLFRRVAAVLSRAALGQLVQNLTEVGVREARQA